MQQARFIETLATRDNFNKIGLLELKEKYVFSVIEAAIAQFLGLSYTVDVSTE